MKKLFLISMSAALLGGCAAFLENRSFIDEMDHQTDGLFVAGRDFESVSGDSGQAYRSRDEIMMRTPASQMGQERREEWTSLRNELYQKESALTPMERQDYSQVRHYLETPSEKIYYLGLSQNERREYLKSRNLTDMLYSDYGHGRGQGRSIASLDPRGYSDNEITLGMGKESVVQRWGRPSQIEVAGDPSNQNERWIYLDNGRPKFLYFEGGLIQGWSMQ